MPSTAQLSAEHLVRACRFIPPAAGSGAAGRPGGRHEEILAYALDLVRATPPTPIVEVEVVVDGRPRIVSLKLDGRSRWGSIKGRTALALVASVAARIGPASTIVESTSGNLGIALAGICAEIGVPFTAVVDSRLPPAMRARIAGYGARLVCADDAGAPDDSLHLLRRIARVREILDQDPDAVWTDQYENPANVAVHRWWTGYELDGQLGSGLQVMFVPVSTGGSFAGTRECLAAVRPELECVAVDVDGSTIFGGPPGRRLLTGIGASKASAFLGESPRPRHVMVSDLEAIAVCRALADDTGIAVGGSSGAAIAGCLRYLHGRPDLSRALCICPDLGASYRETLYDDVWLMEHGAVEALGRPATGGLKIVFTRLSSEWR
jgi:N-(2-amino-2-carboxyethyl)-L-glutamate synthase